MPQSTFYLGEISGLLGRLWLHEVDQATLTAMNDPSFRGGYESLGGFVPQQFDHQSIEDLAVAYCELLIGPKGHVSPVQSVWVDDQLKSETSASMNRFFELFSDYEAPSNLSDHIGVQLDFAGLLLQSDSEAVEEVVVAFARTHLRWTEEFLDRVEAKTDSEFYQGLARVSRALIESVVVT